MVASDKQNDRITHPKKKEVAATGRLTIKLVNNKSFFLHYQSMNVIWQKQNYINYVTFFFLGGGEGGRDNDRHLKKESFFLNT